MTDRVRPDDQTRSTICSAGSCQWCGCTFRKPSDVMHHRCAAMQKAFAAAAKSDVPLWRAHADAAARMHEARGSIYEAFASLGTPLSVDDLLAWWMESPAGRAIQLEVGGRAFGAALGLAMVVVAADREARDG